MKLIQSGAACAFAGLVLSGLTVTSALAMPVTLPTSLNPGDQYRLAFVTSTTRDGTSADISVYNAFVDAIGDTVIASDWKAIASTTTVDAIDNTGTTGTGVPIFLLNDTKLADNYSDLWDGTIDTFLNIDESGSSRSGAEVWTGTSPTGIAAPGNELGSTGLAFIGFNGFKNSQWINSDEEGKNSHYHLYALSGLLSAPGAQIAEPAPLGLLALGLTGFAVLRRKQLARK